MVYHDNTCARYLIHLCPLTWLTSPSMSQRLKAWPKSRPVKERGRPCLDFKVDNLPRMFSDPLRLLCMSAHSALTARLRQQTVFLTDWDMVARLVFAGSFCVSVPFWS